MYVYRWIYLVLVSSWWYSFCISTTPGCINCSADIVLFNYSTWNVFYANYTDYNAAKEGIKNYITMQQKKKRSENEWKDENLGTLIRCIFHKKITAFKWGRKEFPFCFSVVLMFRVLSLYIFSFALHNAFQRYSS